MHDQDQSFLTTKEAILLRQKIYQRFEEEIRVLDAEVFSPDLIVPLWDISDDLLLEIVTADCFDVANMPDEFTYGKTLYSPYLEYDKNNVITAREFADILIETKYKFQKLSIQFEHLPQKQQDGFYNKFYQIIKENLNLREGEFSPSMILSCKGKTLPARKAKKIVKQAARALGLNKKELYCYLKISIFLDFQSRFFYSKWFFTLSLFVWLLSTILLCG